MRVLVDTSVWVDHLRRGNARLAALLGQGRVVSHPFVVGELACGQLANRSEILSLLRALPAAPLADHDEALTMLDQHRLMGRGLGWIDVHLLAAAMLAACSLWTLDRRLAVAVEAVGVRHATSG